ncbi:HARB1-like protein, partial [Mya arenaria]
VLGTTGIFYVAEGEFHEGDYEDDSSGTHEDAEEEESDLRVGIRFKNVKRNHDDRKRGVRGRRDLMNDSSSDLEEMSRLMKLERLTPPAQPMKDHVPQSATEKLAHAQWAMLKTQLEDGSPLPPEQTAEVPDILRLAAKLEAAGVGLPREEFVRMSLALRDLVNMYPNVQAMDRAPNLNDLTEMEIIQRYRFNMNGILYLEQLIGNGITPKGGHANGYYLLEDSGYPAKRSLLTPYLAPQNATEEGYNRSHKITRALVERSIRQLKKRVIVACCVLHNICKERAIPINGDDDSDDEDDNADDQLAQGVQQPPNVAGNRFRDHGHDFHAGAAVTAAVVVSVVAATTSRTVDNFSRCSGVLGILIEGIIDLDPQILLFLRFSALPEGEFHEGDYEDDSSGTHEDAEEEESDLREEDSSLFE